VWRWEEDRSGRRGENEDAAECEAAAVVGRSVHEDDHMASERMSLVRGSTSGWDGC
jgi:hypothetical protein